MPITILVADDSASDRTIIREMLSDHSVLTAVDGVDALRALADHEDVSLLILDLNMPNMNGFEVLEAIRADSRYAKLRTIILTNSDELENEIRGLELGAVDYIRKPLHMASLKARIEVHSALLTARQALEEQLRKQMITYEKIFDQVPVGIAISFNKDAISEGFNVFFSVNPLFEKITGRTREELLAVGWVAITHPDDLAEDLSKYEKLRAGEIDSYEMYKRFIRPDGSTVWVHMIAASLALSEHHQFNHIALIEDISESKAIQRKLTESERSKSVLLSHLPGLAYRCNYDRTWTMQFVSDGCYGLTGYSPESLINNRDISFNDLIAPEYHEMLWQQWESVLAGREPFKHEYEIITSAGERKWVLEMGQGIYSEEGEVEALEGIVIDISDRKAVESILKHNNEHDKWTGLRNRSSLENTLDLDAGGDCAPKRALININLSPIQKLTTIYGFHHMQELVARIAGALQLYCSDDSLLFSTSENRFVIYVKNYGTREELAAFCAPIVEILRAMLSLERIGGGIGIIEIDQTAHQGSDRLLKNLLIASEKALGPDGGDFGICYFDSRIEAEITREQEIKHDLVRIAGGAAGEGFYLQYQPILDLKTNRICGFEALARLSINGVGQIPPLEFVPIAEETKLIMPLGDIIIIKALGFLRRLRENGYYGINVSINVSVIQLLQKDFCSKLLEMIRIMRVPPENVGIEITESVFASNYQEINSILADLKRAGLCIMIDDFGTGYSSLAREHELNVNCLKIDKHFIDGLLSTDMRRECQ
ncbi:MAG: EAL domain-containing protein [Christensenellales bacterium]